MVTRWWNSFCALDICADPITEKNSIGFYFNSQGLVARLRWLTTVSYSWRWLTSGECHSILSHLICSAASTEAWSSNGKSLEPIYRGRMFCALLAAVKAKLLPATSPAQDYTSLPQISITLAFRAGDQREDVQGSARFKQKQYLNMK